MTASDDREWAGYLDTLGRYYRLRRWFAENRQHDVEDILLDQYGRVIPAREDIAAAKAEVTRWRKHLA
jgi:hypothetical protein